ncbi:ureidoglycolate lyase [Cucumibacter marinus]|uniref:ureidoglycolate lyase n=1 Tax=Cucumibacter marinus TaxID=1121252 RepID=UPI000413B02C|nr:ureidoglycolate lyase [Cucumibacter marinus]
MSRHVTIEPLARTAFAPFGQVLDTDGDERFTINAGMTERIHALGEIEIAGQGGKPILSIFRGQPYTLPLTLKMVERHPLGSQAFMPLSDREFLVIVCPDEGGVPGRPRAFLTAPHQGVNLKRNVWHGVLTALDAPSDFLIADRGGPGDNLEEYHFDDPYVIEAPEGKAS